ncbi:corticoliberin-1-like [Xiphias gladius]|uniref:corticoliberin-1-like n=1 Tax=Xiphias gladius TaxID=8245 RepID=UPI001A9A072B|nr:corticoliberin-1-like [Xiphias gladius]XP_040002368.1 corticoliberin-1-like [Xiphias gladius]
MKLNVLLWVVALLGVFLPRSADCRPAGAHAGQHLLLPRPLLLRLGEEFSLQLGGGGLSSSAAAASPDLPSSSSSSSAVNRALLQLTQQLLQAHVEQHRRRQEEEEVEEEEEAGEKGKRSEEPPISLDLTFHLLREVLEMARAEQIAQQANSNRKMMDTFGK